MNVLGLVDHSHAAAAYPIDDTVIAQDQAESLAGQEPFSLILVELAFFEKGVEKGLQVALVQTGMIG